LNNAEHFCPIIRARASEDIFSPRRFARESVVLYSRAHNNSSVRQTKEKRKNNIFSENEKATVLPFFSFLFFLFFFACVRIFFSPFKLHKKLPLLRAFVLPQHHHHPRRDDEDGKYERAKEEEE